MLMNDSDLEPEWALTSISRCTVCFAAYMEVVVVPRVGDLCLPCCPITLSNLTLCFTVNCSGDSTVLRWLQCYLSWVHKWCCTVIDV